MKRRHEPDRRTALTPAFLGRLGIPVAGGDTANALAVRTQSSLTGASGASASIIKRTHFVSRKEKRQQLRVAAKQQRQQRSIAAKRTTVATVNGVAKASAASGAVATAAQRLVSKSFAHRPAAGASAKNRADDDDDDDGDDDGMENGDFDEGDDVGDADSELVSVARKLGIDKNPGAILKGGSVYRELELDGLGDLNDLFLEFDSRKTKYSASDYSRLVSSSSSSSSSLSEAHPAPTKRGALLDRSGTSAAGAAARPLGRNLYGQPTPAIPNPELDAPLHKKRKLSAANDDSESGGGGDDDDAEDENDVAFELDDKDQDLEYDDDDDDEDQYDEDEDKDDFEEERENGNGSEPEPEVDDVSSATVTSTRGPTTVPASSTAYIPPHLRTAAATATTVTSKSTVTSAMRISALDAGATALSTAASAPEEQRRQQLLKRRVQGLYNRLTEDNIDSIASEMRKIYAENARQEINVLLTDALIMTCASPSSLVPALLVASAALVTSLHSSLGGHVGAAFIERVANTLRDSISSAETTRCSNLVLLLTHFYNFGLIDCVLIYSLIEELCKNFCELHIELLLILLKHCGAQLRKDDPASLKDIIASIQGCAKQVVGANIQSDRSIAAIGTGAAFSSSSTSEIASLASKFKPAPTLVSPSASATSSGALGMSFRVQVMLDMIYDLKNNKKRQVDVTDSLQSLRKWLSHLSHRSSGHSTLDQTLRVSWSDLMDVEKKGRWWLVGSAWSGKEATGALLSQVSRTDVDTQQRTVLSAEFGDVSADLQALAKQMRMNTDIRKAIFFAIMGSIDFLDCFEHLQKLNLQGKQQREIVRVLLECCAQEAVYNPFYAHIALKLCSFESAFRFTFQLAFWDHFKQFATMPPRRASNLAKLLAHLVKHGVESLALLKVIEWQNMEASGILFLHSLFVSVLAVSEPEVAKTFVKLAAREELHSVRDGISFFFSKHLVPSLKSTGSDVTAMQAKIKCAKRAMEQMLTLK